MNKDLKQRVLKQLKQYKRLKQNRLNESELDYQKIVNKKLKQLKVPVTLGPEINSGKYEEFRRTIY